jgi:hypothetical protein
MANRNAAHGFGFRGTVHGGAPLCQELAKAVGYGTALFINDVIHRVADGSIEHISSNFTPGTTNPSGISMNWGALSKATTHQCIVDPLGIFEAQDNDATNGILAVDLGLNANVVSGTGSATTLLSGDMINISGMTTTATLDLHLLKLYAASDNVHGPFARIEVLFNKHRYASGSAGI